MRLFGVYKETQTEIFLKTPVIRRFFLDFGFLKSMI